MGKVRERKDGQLNWRDSVWNYLLQFVIGYGRRPWQALVISGGVIAVFTWYFHRRKDAIAPVKEGQPAQGHAGQTKRRSWPLWYSVDLFAPVIDLGVAKAWMPSRDAGEWLVFWTYFERLLGWFLVPLGVAAITGLVK